MQCLILAGGLGTRMKSIAGDAPKGLLPVGPRTFIDWQLRWLRRLGADRVTLALGYHASEFRAHVEGLVASAEAPDVYPKLSFSFDGPGSQAGEYLGTGGALRNASALLDDEFLVTYGDSFLFVRCDALLKEHRRSGRAVTLAIFHNRGAGDSSNVIYRDGRIVLYDKVARLPEMEHIDYGMAALSKKDFLGHTPAGAFDLADYYKAAGSRGELGAFVARETFREIGSPEGYRAFCELMKANEYDLARLEKLVT